MVWWGTRWLVKRMITTSTITAAIPLKPPRSTSGMLSNISSRYLANFSIRTFLGIAPYWTFKISSTTLCSSIKGIRFIKDASKLYGRGAKVNQKPACRLEILGRPIVLWSDVTYWKGLTTVYPHSWCPTSLETAVKRKTRINPASISVSAGYRFPRAQARRSSSGRRWTQHLKLRWLARKTSATSSWGISSRKLKRNPVFLGRGRTMSKRLSKDRTYLVVKEALLARWILTFARFRRKKLRYSSQKVTPQSKSSRTFLSRRLKRRAPWRRRTPWKSA